MIPGKWRLLLNFSRGLAKLSGISLAESPDDPKKFVLIANQRTGSTWIIDLLNSHPGMTTYSELFHGAVFGRPGVGGNRDILMWNSYAASKGLPRSRFERMRLYFRYFDEEVYRQRNGCHAAGFKLMYNQLACEFYVLAYIKSRRVAIIHLTRSNHLDAVLSEEAVSIRNVAHAHTGSEVAPIRIEVDPYTLIGRLEDRSRKVQQAREFLTRIDVPYLEIEYEEISADASRIRDVLRLLEIDTTDDPLTSTLQKLNRADHQQLIANYGEIRTLLEGTEFRRLLR